MTKSSVKPILVSFAGLLIVVVVAVAGIYFFAGDRAYCAKVEDLDTDPRLLNMTVPPSKSDLAYLNMKVGAIRDEAPDSVRSDWELFSQAGSRSGLRPTDLIDAMDRIGHQVEQDCGIELKLVER